MISKIDETRYGLACRVARIEAQSLPALNAKAEILRDWLGTERDEVADQLSTSICRDIARLSISQREGGVADPSGKEEERKADGRDWTKADLGWIETHKAYELLEDVVSEGKPWSAVAQSALSLAVAALVLHQSASELASTGSDHASDLKSDPDATVRLEFEHSLLVVRDALRHLSNQ